MSEGLSKVDQHAYRSSYRKHRERLADIRHNLTVKDFFLEAHPRPQDKKGILRNKLKKQEIQYQNSMLKNKINGIKARTPQQIEPSQFVSRTEQVRQQPIRYDQLEDTKIQIESDFSDGQPIKCIIPSKARAFSLIPHSKPLLKPQIKSFFTSKPEKAYKQKRPESFHRSKNSERAHSHHKITQKEVYYNLPQRNQQRQVIHHKTVILSTRQSCLYELSLIGQRMLIAAHIMGAEKSCITQLLSQKKSKAIMKEYQGNFEQLYSKIILEESNKKYFAIKIDLKGRDSQIKDKPSEEEKIKRRAKLQNEFLKRNYYDTLKKQEDRHSEGSNQKPTITHQKLEDLVQRLAAPKRYLIKDHNYQPPPNPTVHSKISIHIDSKDVQARNQKMKQKALEIRQQLNNNNLQQNYLQSNNNHIQQPRVILKKTESLTIDKDISPLGHRTSLYQNNNSILKKSIEGKAQVIESKIINNHRQQQQDVQYLYGEDQEYKQQFDDPSLASKSNPHGSIQLDNNSYVSHKSKRSQHAKHQVATAKIQANQEHNIQQEQYQNQDYQEVFQQSGPKKEIIEKPSEIKKNSLPQQNEVEEEYAEQFQS